MSDSHRTRLDTNGVSGFDEKMFTVSHLTHSYIAHLKVRVSLGEVEPATLVWYRSQLQKLDRAVGPFPAAELRAEHLVAVEFSNAFVRVLKALYRWACDDDVGLLRRDPFRKLKTPPCGERQRILTRDEMVRLYRASNPQLRRFLFVMSRTLARPGEIRRLEWGQIQWDRRLISLTKFKGKKRRRDGTKVRLIPLDRVTWRLLRNIHARCGRPGPDMPVWLDRHGNPWSANAVHCAVRDARDRAGLDPDGVEERVVCYHLRHTGATNATRAGVADATLAKVMGHARTTTTNRYQHLAGDDVVNAIDRVAARRPPKAG